MILVDSLVLEMYMTSTYPLLLMSVEYIPVLRFLLEDGIHVQYSSIQDNVVVEDIIGLDY